MKKPLYKNYLFWILVIVVLVAGSLFANIHLPQTISSTGNVDNSSASSTAGEQSVESASDGYAFSVPNSWYVEKSGDHSVTIYPDYSPTNTSSSPVCKIEMSVFSYASSTNVSDWISKRLSADPTINVSERSSETISIGAGSGIKWIGTINGISTTLVYGFSESHAYEIAPSLVTSTGEGSAADDACENSLDIFLQTLTI